MNPVMLCTEKVRAFLFTNYAPINIVSGYQNIKPTDHIIAVDNGLKYIDELGLRPNILIGDQDSLEPALLKKYSQIPCYLHPPEKNDTDTELAINWCIDQQCYAEIIICNDLEGRFDHSVAIALNLLKLPNPIAERMIFPTPYRIESNKQTVFILPENIEFNNCEGKLLSLIALSERIEFYSSQNLKYTLNNLVIKQFQSRGISNLITSKQASISKKEGICLAILSEY